MIKLTIIIPFYNIEFFDKTLQSFLQQSDKRFNVFVGNDNSPFSPEHLINKFNRGLNITYKKFENNLGHVDLTKHWSRCIKEIDTTWFMIVGDDDSLSADAIEEFYKIVNNPDLGTYSVLRFQSQIVNDKNESKSDVFNYQDMEASSTFMYKKSKNEVRSSLGEFVFKKSDFLKYGIKYYPKAFYSDNMMILEYSNFSLIKNIDNAVVFIRITKNSLSGNPNSRKAIEHASALFYYDIIKNYFNKFKQKELSFFYNYIIKGIVNRNLKISKIIFIKLCIRDLGFFLTFKKLIVLFKNQLFHNENKNFE